MIIALCLVAVVAMSPIYAQTPSIPDWIKNSALWHGQGEINDDEFFDMLQFLIDRDIITVPNTSSAALQDRVDDLELELSELKADTARDIQSAYDDGYNSGYDDGYSSVTSGDEYNSGYDDGYRYGYNDGHSDGWDDGDSSSKYDYSIGYQSGYDDGYNEGSSSVNSGRYYVDKAWIEPVIGAGVPGCEETSEGCFAPSVATVEAEGIVIFSNTGPMRHSFTSGSVGALDYAFDSGLVLSGDVFAWSPSSPGQYDYFCIVHPWMEGSIIVS